MNGSVDTFSASDFCQFFLIFLKLFPVIPISEVKELEIHARSHAHGAHSEAH